MYVFFFFSSFLNPQTSKHRNYVIEDVQILDYTSSFCVSIVQLFTEFPENKHNILSQFCRFFRGASSKVNLGKFAQLETAQGEGWEHILSNRNMVRSKQGKC